MRVEPLNTRLSMRLCALLACAALSGWAQAQAPAPVLPAPPDPAPTLAPDAQRPAAAVVQVQHYLVRGVTLLDATQVMSALSGMTGLRTVEELHRAAATVQALYADAGYGAVVVYLPPQDASGGVVTLQVIEGRISAVRVAGANAGFDAANVLASLPALLLQRTPRLDRIDAQLRLANDNPAKRTRLVLLPGGQPEQTEAEISVQAGPARQIGLELDNSGSAATGRARVGLVWRDANASGRDDVLEWRLQLAPEAPRQASAASLTYRLPLYAQTLSLEAFALVSDSRSDNIPTAAGALRFAGRGHLLGLRATHVLPRLGLFDARLGVAIERREQRNQCAIGSLPDAACGSAGGNLSITPLTLEFSLLGAQELPLVLSAALVQGLAWGGGAHARRAAFDAVRPGAAPGFTALRLQASARQRLGDGGWYAVARLAGQGSAHPLVPAMQFGAGGRDSVRGYDERELAADHGLALSLELSAPAKALPAWAGSSLRALVFADAAALRNRDAAPCSGLRTRCQLAGAGIGLRLDAASLSAGLDVAHALHAGSATPRGRSRAHLWLRHVH